MVFLPIFLPFFLPKLEMTQDKKNVAKTGNSSSPAPRGGGGWKAQIKSLIGVIDLLDFESDSN